MIGSIPATGVAASGSTRQAVASAPDAGFGDMLAQIAGDGLSALKNGETLSMAALGGKAGPQEAVNSVMQAERSLHMAIAVRDRLVAAWQDISRMSI